MDAFWLALASQIVVIRRQKAAIVYAERMLLEGIRASGLVAGAQSASHYFVCLDPDYDPWAEYRDGG